MGGSGSGNWYRFDSKTRVEDCLNIDARHLDRKGCLEPWQGYSWEWQNGSNIFIKTEPEAIELIYTIIKNGEQREEVDYRVPLSWTSCNYGGKRPWFICPGKGCGRRVAKLYMKSGYFLCRHCHDLVYSSQRESKAFRLLDKSQKICRKLGANTFNDLFLTPKPKGMHQRTYDKLYHRAEELDNESLYAAIKRSNTHYIKLQKIKEKFKK